MFFRFKIFHNILILYTLLLFFTLDNQLLTAIKNGEYVYWILFFALGIVSYYCFYTCGGNPGYATDTVQQEEFRVIVDWQSSIEMVDRSERSSTSREGSQQENRESVRSSRTGLSSFHENNEGDEEEKAQESNRGRRNTNNYRVEPSNAWRNTGPSNPLLPDKRFCETCQIVQPYRTKHCQVCEKCIHKFDHHCVWLGRN